MALELPTTGDQSLVFRKFLANRGKRALIIAPTSVISELEKIKPTHDWLSSEHYDGNLKGRNFIFVLVANELEVCTRIKRENPNANVFSIRYEVVPALLCQESPLNLTKATALRNIEKYAIFCCPRTGSTYLCSLLSQAGFGNPTEHLRAQLGRLISESGELRAIFNSTIQLGERNGFFGTKIISHFLFDTFKEKPEQSKFIEYLNDNSFKFIYLNRSIVSRSISSYFARKTNLWHMHENMDVNAHHSNVPYNRGQLINIVNSMRIQDTIIRELLADARVEILNVDYEDVAADPVNAIKACERHITGHNERRIDWSTFDFEKAPKPISQSSERMKEFEIRLRNDLDL